MVPSASLDDAEDDDTADYIELIILAIIKNMERQQAYRAAPSVQLRREIKEHSRFITNAKNCTSKHIQRSNRNFKQTIKYDDLVSDNDTETKQNK